jgi:tetratricopeptide (TPR) repeat protein
MADESKFYVREPLSPTKQKRLDAMLEHALQKVASDKPDFKPEHDYATELLTQCVLGNPSNILYVRAYIENLQKKYNNNKTGKTLAKFQELGARKAQRKAIDQGHWDEAIKHGLQILTANPWDKTALMNMAKASSKTPADWEVELYYLQTALLPNPKDPEINEMCAVASMNMGNIDQAITCWRRVELGKPARAEYARHQIADLNMRRMNPKDGTAADPTRRAGPATVEAVLTPEKKLLRKIEQQPDRIESYVELSEFYLHGERYSDAVKILTRAVEQSGGNDEIREKLEDAQLRYLRQKISHIKDPEERKKQEKRLFTKELEICKNRCERYPNDALWRYDLGYHYMLLKQYPEAIRELQRARHDPRRKGSCLLALGQCFQHIQQYPLAMDHYEMAIEEIPDRDAVNKKRALYLAGKLALGLRDLEKADNHLKVLASLDFTYKDVAALLDKLAEKRKNGPSDSNGSPHEPPK